MPKIVVTAAVKDVDAWLKFKPEMVAQMSAVASAMEQYGMIPPVTVYIEK